MNIALLSDIHANPVALAAVLTDARALGVERLLCCGDFVGYYYAPDAVFELLDEWHWIGIRGNHEVMLERWLSGHDHDSIGRKYGSGISVAASMPRPTIDRLLALPSKAELVIDERTVLLCHGSPWDPDHYIYPNAADSEKQRLAEGRHDLVVFGHSHYPVVWHIDDTTVVNPGSVGQPRDRKPGASWALWNSRDMRISLKRTFFNPESIAKLARERDPQLPYLAHILTRH